MAFAYTGMGEFCEAVRGRLRMAVFSAPEREGCPVPRACIMDVLFIACTRDSRTVSAFLCVI